MNPWISIVVPSFNQAQFLDATLKSLLEQQEDGLEILVVDGDSRDGSVNIIRRHADRLAWWVSEPDSGQSEALNKGFARAKGSWLGWLNSDDLLLPHALATLRQSIGREPEREWWIGGGRFVDENGKPQRSYGPPHGLGVASDLSDWRRLWFAQPGTFFRRGLFDRAGAQAKADLHYAMDLELWLRFLKIAPPGMIDAELAAYRLHDQAKTSVLTAGCEAEIAHVLMDALGFDAVLARIGVIASDREEYQRKLQRLESKVQPLLKLNAAAKRVLRSR